MHEKEGVFCVLQLLGSPNFLGSLKMPGERGIKGPLKLA
jgi:hypothetical protein